LVTLERPFSIGPAPAPSRPTRLRLNAPAGFPNMDRTRERPVGLTRAVVAGRSVLVSLVDDLRHFLDDVLVLPRRVLLETPGVQATVPMLRGVWGAALHGLDQRVYQRVFAPASNGARPADARGQSPAPGYLIRPAPPDPQFAPAMDWFLFGDAVRYECTLWRAWDVASGLGLGKRRQRFFLRQTRWLQPDGSPSARPAVWPLSHARWPLDPPETTSCRLVFPAPLRILHKKRLVERPQVPDLVAAAVRRVRAFLPPERWTAWDTVAKQAVALAHATRCGPWHGHRLDLQRYSARQKAELELRGVTGWLELPQGPGPLWPLLLVGSWLHLGKGTVLGLGQLVVEPAEGRMDYDRTSQPGENVSASRHQQKK